jgi:hypothetical protein
MSEQTHERELLDEALAGEFWTLFSAHVTREWGPAGLRYQQAVQEAANAPEAVAKLRMVLHTQQELLALMRWPADRLAQLTAQAKTPLDPPSRRGPGL